jgi:polyhydroxyalkanoate synthesis regulator phasin
MNGSIIMVYILGGVIMLNELKNVFLAGVGSAAYTYEKAIKLVDEMVQKGKITVDEGKELSEELKRTVKTKTSDESSKPITKEDFRELLKEMDFASKEDFDSLNNRLNSLEEKINKNDAE